MKRRLKLFVVLYGLMIFTFGQTGDIKLTFTALDSLSFVQMDSIKIMNRTHGGDTILFYPDTILLMDITVGIPFEHDKNNGFHLSNCVPNPVNDHGLIMLNLPEKGLVTMIISDIHGRKVIVSEGMMEKGNHSFRFVSGSLKIYVLTAYWKDLSKSIKILKGSSRTNGICAIEYQGMRNPDPYLKSSKNKGGFEYYSGDQLLCAGYMDTLQSGIPICPDADEEIVFQFAYSMPCPGIPVINYEGQEYNTLQVFSQCWFKENLNVGNKILGSQTMTDDDIIEKYCYNNQDVKCDEWGGLYQWHEMMQYSSISGCQGICPPGWHIPTDEDIKVLEGSIDSQHGIGDDEWDGWDFRGLDIGYLIRSSSTWTYNGNGPDYYGFTILPAGARFTNGTFIHSGNHAYMWSSNEHVSEYAWGRLIYTFNESGRSSYNAEYGFSLRCLKDY